MTTTTLLFSGAVQNYVVPTGVTSVVLQCKGASGSPWGGLGGGTGATVQGTLAVTPGETLGVYVGGAGMFGATTTPGLGGWNGGATGGAASASGKASGNGGGGASDVRQGGSALANRKIVAGGGGSAGGTGTGGGGGSLGGSGSAGSGGDAGGGGGPSAGGISSGSIPGGTGTLGNGGVGSGTNTVGDGPGGGGGGLWGGAGGGFDAGTGANPGGGGGGSSSAAGCTATSTIAAGVTGGNTFAFNQDGFVTITTVDTAPTAPTLTLPLNAGFADVDNAVLGWTFNDPDAGDTQSSADLRYRVLGSTSWITLPLIVSGATNTYRLAGLTIGVTYEWQLRTYDAQGTVGPYSSSFTFTAKLHPAVVVLTPSAGQPITSLSQALSWVQIRDESGYTVRRLGDANGQPDTSNVIETITIGTASGSSQTFSNTSHNNGPEHWQVQVATFSGQINSDWVDIPVVMSLTPPTTPTCTATAVPANGSISVRSVLAELSVDFFPLSTLPSNADTGQALTHVGSPTAGGGYMSGATVFSESATLAGKVLAMQCSFRQNALGASHTNNLYMVATDASNNAHIYCGIDAGHWYIKKNVAGTLTTLASGTLATPITTSQYNAYPWAMSASISGTTVTFVDPSGTTHTATDAVIGSFTGTIAKILGDNSAASNDTWKIAHWSATSTAAAVAQYGFLERSLDGTNFDAIPGSEWDGAEFGAVPTYVDYAAPFNRQVWYRANALTVAGALARSAIS